MQEDAFTDGRLDWVDTMALDAEGRLWFTINRVVAFVTVRRHCSPRAFLLVPCLPACWQKVNSHRAIREEVDQPLATAAPPPG